jgi:hypothetical protein
MFQILFLLLLYFYILQRSKEFLFLVISGNQIHDGGGAHDDDGGDAHDDVRSHAHDDDDGDAHDDVRNHAHDDGGDAHDDVRNHAHGDVQTHDDDGDFRKNRIQNRSRIPHQVLHQLLDGYEK